MYFPATHLNYIWQVGFLARDKGDIFPISFFVYTAASCTPERPNAVRHRLLPLGHLMRSIHVGKAEQADVFEGSLFQAVAQVNPTAQNTFLLGPPFSSFLAYSFILAHFLCLNPLADCLQCPFCFRSFLILRLHMFRSFLHFSF